MRLFSLLLIPLIAAWSQTANQQTQPPIVVQIRQPPANPTMHLLELVIPVFIGGVIGFLSAWITNRQNANERKADRQHDLVKIDRQNGFALKRDVLLKAVQSMVQQFNALAIWYNAKYYAAVNGGDDLWAAEEDRNTLEDYFLRRRESQQAIAVSSVGISHDLWKAGEEVVFRIEAGRRGNVKQRQRQLFRRYI